MSAGVLRSSFLRNFTQFMRQNCSMVNLWKSTQKWSEKNLWNTAFKKFEVIWSVKTNYKGCIPQILLGPFLNFCLVLLGKVADKKHSERLKVWYFLGNSVANALIILFENSPDNSLSELPFHKSNLNNPFWPCLCSRSFLNLRFIIWILFEYYLRHIISSINRSENSWKVFENPLKTL